MMMKEYNKLKEYDNAITAVSKLGLTARDCLSVDEFNNLVDLLTNISVACEKRIIETIKARKQFERKER